jgi:hypothetical protein
MIRPECDQEVADNDELHLAPRLIQLCVIPDLLRIVGKLVEQPDQFPLPQFRKRHEKRGGLGRQNRLV